MNSLAAKTFEDALLKHKPMRRSRLVSKTPLKARNGAGRAKKKRKPSVKTLKNKVWVQFSIFIRTRDADAEGMVICVTCGLKLHWTQAQAGHFIAGRTNAVLFCETGTHVQCYACNVPKHGNGVEYCLFMQNTYGDKVVDELRLAATKTRKWIAGELESLLGKYKILNQAHPLLKEKPTAES